MSLPEGFHENPCQISRSGRSLHEAGEVTKSTNLRVGQLLVFVELHEDQSRAKLRVNRVPTIGSLLSEATNQHGALLVDAHRHLVQIDSSVLQIARLMTVDPILFGKQESQRADPDKIIREHLLQESSISAHFGGSPGLGKFLDLFCNLFLSNYSAPLPICCTTRCKQTSRKTSVSTPEPLI